MVNGDKGSNGRMYNGPQRYQVLRLEPLNVIYIMYRWIYKGGIIATYLGDTPILWYTHHHFHKRETKAQMTKMNEYRTESLAMLPNAKECWLRLEKTAYFPRVSRWRTTVPASWFQTRASDTVRTNFLLSYYLIQSCYISHRKLINSQLCS